MPKLKLNDEMIHKIVELLEQGNYIETVCKIVRIDESSFYSYIKKAEQHKKDNVQSIYVKLLDSIKEAEAKAEALAVACIIQDKSWQSKAWYLERKYKARWAQQPETVIQVNNNSQYAALTDVELKALANGTQVHQVHDVPLINDSNKHVDSNNDDDNAQ